LGQSSSRDIFGDLTDNISFYNKTPYSGLETHISNSYANPLLQVLHFIPSIRNLALQHTATPCINPLCLLCEMGFLFDMLEKAEGSTCQATNMLKTLSNHPQGMDEVCFSALATDFALAGPLNLLEEEGPRTPLTNMLQGLNRFLLERIAQDWKGIYPRSTLFDQVFFLFNLCVVD
jgi:PAB-dependent poly(A)-specific ribonuclease subunit 2